MLKLSLSCKSFSYIANPKSPNFAIPWVKRMFSDFISLWTILFCFIVRRACARFLANLTTSGYGSPTLEYWISLNKSPSSQSSVMTKQKEFVSYTSYIPMIKSDSSFFWHLISFDKRAFCVSFLKISRSIILTQTGFWFYLSIPK